MITNADITLYHYDEEEEIWLKQEYRRASFYSSTNVAVDKAGLSSADVAKIRIPTRDTIAIANGDKIMRGVSLENIPDREKSVTVIGWSDNRRGNLPHWKVTCK